MRHVARHVHAHGAVEQHDEGRCPHQVAEWRRIKERGQHGSAAKEEQGDNQPHAQVEPEQGVGVLLCVILLADEGAAKAICCQRSCRGEEDGGEPHEPHFLLAQQSRQYHAVHQGDGLQRAFLQQHPAQAMGCFAGDAGHLGEKGIVNNE